VLIRSGELLPANSQGWLALLAIPLVWGAGPIVLAIIWLTIKRWNLSAAKFGLLVFAALYLVIAAGALLVALLSRIAMSLQCLVASSRHGPLTRIAAA
jgi:hypothetical protein